MSKKSNSIVNKISLINQVVLECMNASNEREIYKKFVEAAISVLSADYGYSFIWDKTTKQFKFFYKDKHTPFISKTPRKKGITSKVFNSQQPQYIPHAGKEDAVRGHAKQYMKGVVIIPISYKRNKYGVLDICFYKKHSFTAEEKHLCAYIGSSAAQAITINRLYSDLEERVINRTWELEKSRAEVIQDKAKDEAILASIGEGIVVTNIQGVVTNINTAALEMLGITETDILGKKWLEAVEAKDERGKVIPPEKRPVSLALSGIESTSINYYQRPDGAPLAAATTNAPVLFNNILIGAVITFRDVSKEREIDRAKTEFVSLASHQLRTPLSAINWYTEALLSKDLGKINEKQSQYVSQIKKSSDRMIELVNGLLNISRIELGTLVLEPRSLALAEYAQIVLKELKPIIAEKKLRVKTVLPPQKTIETDPRLLKIILQNLLSNSVKYTPYKGKIELHVENKSHKGIKGVCIRVSDTGCGIPKKQIPFIFSKLFRADNAKTKDPDGTGLGLYLIKSMLEYGGGDIWFTTKENHGSTFFVFLPERASRIEDATAIHHPA
jgi:PAS domain S-box-containing protein